MKLLAIGINYEHGVTFSREFEPREDLTDQEILEDMADHAEIDDELEQVLLVTAEVNARGEIHFCVDELIG